MTSPSKDLYVEVLMKLEDYEAFVQKDWTVLWKGDLRKRQEIAFLYKQIAILKQK